MRERPFLVGRFAVILGDKEPTSGLSWLNANSIYFEVLGEHGFVGLALFLVLGIATIQTATFIIRHARDRPEDRCAADLARMIQVSLVGYAVGGAFANLAFFDLVYHLVAIVGLSSAVIEESLVVRSEKEKPFERRPLTTARMTPHPSGTAREGAMRG